MKKIMMLYFRISSLVTLLLGHSAGAYSQSESEFVDCEKEDNSDSTIICNEAKYIKVKTLTHSVEISGGSNSAGINKCTPVGCTPGCGPTLCKPGGGYGCSPKTQDCPPYDLCDPQLDGCYITWDDFPDPPDDPDE